MDKVSIESLNSLKNNRLVSIISPSVNKIILELHAQDNDEKYHFNLNISNVIKVYYQRFESSIQREGFRNINRLKLNVDNPEWINQFTTWQNPFVHESGFELLLYNGSILRFVGDTIIFEKEVLEDILDFQDQQSVPDHVKQTVAKIIANTSFSKKRESENIEKGEIVEQNETITTEESIQPSIIENDVEVNQDTSSQSELEDSMEGIEEGGIIQETGISEFSQDDLEIEELKKENIQMVKEDSPQENEEIIQIHEERAFEEDPIEDEEFSQTYIKKESEEIKIDQSSKIDETEQIHKIEVDKENEELKQNNLLSQINDEEAIIEEDIPSEDESNILKVNGVTTQNMDSLISIGFDTIEKLASVKINQLIKINGIGKATAKKIIQSANILIQEFKP